MRYVDGFVLPVPKKKMAAYRRMAQKAGKVWRDHGALEYVECVADDVKPGKHTSFPAERQAQARRDGGVRLHRLQVARPSRPRQRQGHERPAPGKDDGSEGHAVRRQAHVLGRIQSHGRGLRTH